MTNNYYEQVYAVVRRIPRGQVTSYGRIARMLGRNRAARAVGYALNALKDRNDDTDYADIPWQRVVNSKGHISIVNREFSANLQADLLRGEGIPVTEDLRIPELEQFLWEGLSLGELEAIIAGKV